MSAQPSLPDARPFLLGLTGGLASGKSTVGRLLAERGCEVVDADQLVAALYRPGAPGVTEVEDLFGPEALDGNGGVDHQAVAARIFREPALRRALEARIHPLVGQAFAARAAATACDVVVLEAPLLVEAGLADHFDLVVTVETDPAKQLARAIDRGMSEDDARARLAAQGDGAPRRARADLVLGNDAGLDALEDAVEALVRDIRARVASPR